MRFHVCWWLRFYCICFVILFYFSFSSSSFRVMAPSTCQPASSLLISGRSPQQDAHPWRWWGPKPEEKDNFFFIVTATLMLRVGGKWFNRLLKKLILASISISTALQSGAPSTWIWVNRFLANDMQPSHKTRAKKQDKLLLTADCDWKEYRRVTSMQAKPHDNGSLLSKKSLYIHIEILWP